MSGTIESDARPSQQARRLVAIARLLRGVTAFAQIALMVTLFLMWKQFHVPFGQAFARCFVAGLTIYIVLGTVSSLLLTIARVQPVQFLLRHLFAVVSLAIFAALHYVYKLGILQSAIAWAVIYFSARLLVSRVESRAARHFAGR